MVLVDDGEVSAVVVPVSCLACGGKLRVVNDSQPGSWFRQSIVLGCLRRNCGRQVHVSVDLMHMRHSPRNSERKGVPT